VTSPSPTPTPRRKLKARWIGAAIALVVVGLFVSALGDPSPDREPKGGAMPATDMFPHAGKDVIDLLDGLRPGERLAGCEVLTIAEPKDGVANIDLQKGEGLFMVGVLAKRDQGPTPPIETDKYGVVIGHIRGTSPPSGDVMQQAAEEVAARIRRREGTVPKPKGM